MLIHSEQLAYAEAAADLGMGPGPGPRNAAAEWRGTAQRPPAETSSDRDLQPLLNGALGPAACSHHTEPLFMMQLLLCSQSQIMMTWSVRSSGAVTCCTSAEHEVNICSL